LALRQGDLQSARFDDNSFDAATLSHVIEHVPDPVALLREIGRILKPGGRLVVTTPNSKSLGHGWFQRYWIGLDPPRHLNIFTLSALRECANRAGLHVVETKSTAANADIVLGGSYSICHFHQQADRSAPRPQINIARSIRCAWLQYREYFSLMRNPECGEEAVLICAKKSV
jgi:SAM-dependent methyltransferase